MKIFFGTGNMARLALEQVGTIPENIEIIGFIDNNPEKWGEFLGKKCILQQNNVKLILM